MHEPVSSPYLVPFDGTFRVAKAVTGPPADAETEKKLEKQLRKLVEELDDLQRVLYADDRYAILCVFQAMDAAGKDGTIRKVFSGVNPAGFQVSSFKKPSALELDHDFLWRTTLRLPQRGRIGVFNRSHYEEVLVVRVHPEYLEYQKLPDAVDRDSIWEERFESIREYEQHLARNGTIVLKFWLNVSREEQRRRFLSRIDEPEKNWKFSEGDVRERSFWDQYMDAYESALNGTSRPDAPWYAIPADDKDYMRVCVADVIARTLRGLDLRYPTVDDAALGRFEQMRSILQGDR